MIFTTMPHKGLKAMGLKSNLGWKKNLRKKIYAWIGNQHQKQQ